MRVVLHVFRVLVGVESDVLFHFVRGHIVGFHVFVVHVECCSCIRSSFGLFFMWVVGLCVGCSSCVCSSCGCCKLCVGSFRFWSYS